jgi:hypothetical protein
MADPPRVRGPQIFPRRALDHGNSRVQRAVCRGIVKEAPLLSNCAEEVGRRFFGYRVAVMGRTGGGTGAIAGRGASGRMFIGFLLSN